ncbi:MAG: hypothetical protein SFT92_09285 [Rickettsiales bacterium]|nr:hypothetical protein [Rickettsiales bacterium]
MKRMRQWNKWFAVGKKVGLCSALCALAMGLSMKAVLAAVISNPNKQSTVGTSHKLFLCQPVVGAEGSEGSGGSGSDTECP